MVVVIITGGIGSGKSSVCSILERIYGWPVYEADGKVKELYDSHPDLLSDIETGLSECFRDNDGNFLPELLASRIFSDSVALKVVESHVFPVLTEDFQKWKLRNDDKAFGILESATILQKPQLSGLGDIVAVVDAPLQLRVDRASRRDGMSREKVLSRVMNQKLMNDISAGYVPSSVDYVIFNDSSEEDLKEKVSVFVDYIMKQ